MDIVDSLLTLSSGVIDANRQRDQAAQGLEQLTSDFEQAQRETVQLSRKLHDLAAAHLKDGELLSCGSDACLEFAADRRAVQTRKIVSPFELARRIQSAAKAQASAEPPTVAVVAEAVADELGLMDSSPCPEFDPQNLCF